MGIRFKPSEIILDGPQGQQSSLQASVWSDWGGWGFLFSNSDIFLKPNGGLGEQKCKHLARPQPVQDQP